MRRLAAAALACGVLAATGCGGGSPPEGPTTLTVAAASDLRPAFAELGRRFEAREGVAATFSFGSSGHLAQQIRNGAPFDLFASAGAGYVDDVVRAGRGDPESVRAYARGRLVVWSRDAELRLEDLDGPAVRALAIANPQHAPYGAAAEQALRRARLLDAVGDRLVLAESASDALRLAVSGNADAALVPLSLALGHDGGTWTRVDPALHDPIEQVLVVTAEGGGARPARRFAALVTSAEGRAVLRRFGLAPPDDAAEAAGGR